MTITSTVFTPLGGTTIFSDPSLCYVQIIRLCREGLGYNRDNVVGNRKFVHDQAAGSVEFENTFAGDPSNDVDSEKLFIKYKY